MDRIILPELMVMGNHGLTQIEQLIKQPFVINIVMELDLSQAAASDDIADTIDYGSLYEKIKTEAETKRFRLIEALAGSIADIILQDSRVVLARVRVEKSQARHGNNVFPAAVVIEKHRA
jgi:dihydroneopterin aldolase